MKSCGRRGEREPYNHVAFLVLRVNLLKGKRTGILDQADRVQGFTLQCILAL
jgi:hypothetical protein